MAEVDPSVGVTADSNYSEYQSSYESSMEELTAEVCAVEERTLPGLEESDIDEKEDPLVSEGNNREETDRTIHASTEMDSDPALEPAIEVIKCHKCHNEVPEELQITFTRCRHVYCAVCIIESTVTRPNSLLVPCPDIRCSSSMAAAKMRKMYPDTFGAVGNTPSRHEQNQRSKSFVVLTSDSQNNVKNSPDVAHRRRRVQSSAKINVSPEEDELASVLAVACPRCRAAVTSDPNAEAVTCSQCDFVFCFACLQDMKVELNGPHMCQSSSLGDQMGDVSPRITQKRAEGSPLRRLFSLPARLFRRLLRRHNKPTPNVQ